MSDLWNELKKEFQDFFSVLCVQEPRENEIRASRRDDSHIFYLLCNEGDCCRLEFRVEYGNHHWELINALKSRFPIRDFAYWTHYTDSIWTQRQRITTSDELEDGLKMLAEIVRCEKPAQNQAGQDNDGLPVKICNNITAQELLTWQLRVPDYQRPYCWREKNIRDFLVDIALWQGDETKSGLPYHLGSVILSEPQPNNFDIIDGQQRLTTMAILSWLQEVKVPLLTSRKRYREEEIQTILRARDYIKNSKTIIKLDQIELSVVILAQGQPADLAYTFFSSSNSTGKRLSDYDLLKTHHLRYITGGQAAEKFSTR